MTRPTYGTRIRGIRSALARADRPLSIAEIRDACGTCSDTVQVATAVHGDHAHGLVRRTGSCGAYRYELTDAGRAAVENPNALRSGRNRRTNNRRVPRIAALIEDHAHA